MVVVEYSCFQMQEIWNDQTYSTLDSLNLRDAFSTTKQSVFLWRSSIKTDGTTSPLNYTDYLSLHHP